MSDTELAEGEILLGYVPSRDGTGYRSNSNPPGFPFISRAADGLHTDEVILVIIGKLYKGGTPISGVSAVLGVDDIHNAMLEMQGGKKSYNEVMRELMNLNETPIHITGVILKPGY